MATEQIQTGTQQVGLRGALRPVAALLFGVLLLYAGYGLQATLVPLRADAEGFARVAIGFLGSGYYVGFVVGCLFGPMLILRAGHIRAFAAMVACLSAAILAFPLLIGEAQWLVFRIAIGLCIAVLLVIVESWLNEKATNQTRGIVMSSYVIITYAAIVVGQMGVTVLPLTGFALFSICSIVLSLAAVPVALTRSSQPAPIAVVRFRPRHLYTIAPAAFVGIFITGVVNGSVFGLGTIYAIDTGFSKTEAAIFVSAMVLGGAIGQYPFGRISDFVDRRLVLLVTTTGTGAVSLLLALATGASETVLVSLAFALGMLMFPGYSLAAAHAYDWAAPEDMVETSAGLLVLFGLGSSFGPLLASTMMALLGPGGLFLTNAAAAIALALFIGFRLFRRSRPDEEMRSAFDIYSTAPVGGAITPEPVDASLPDVELPQVALLPVEPAAGAAEPPLPDGASRPHLGTNT